MCKKALVLFFTFLFSIESFAAVVSDNDGSAFITKAEFEALKKNFSTQIDNYNKSIDSKIDGAIAAYLAGTRLSKEEKLLLDPKCMYHFPMVLDHLSRWADADSKYYNVSSPKIEQKEFNMIYKSFSDGQFPTLNITVDPSNVSSYAVPKMPSTVDYHWANSSSLMEVTRTTVGVSGFINSVTDINGQRTIGSSTYDTRERLTAGYGYDVATYVSDVLTYDGGSHYISDNPADITNKYHYYQIYGLPPAHGTSAPTYNWAGTTDRNHTFTPEKMVGTRFGHGNSNNAYSISAMGNTYNSFFEHKANNDPGGWCTNQGGFYDLTPYSNVFNWTNGGVVDHVYAFSGNMPAEKLGYWDLRVDKDTNNDSNYRRLTFNNNSDKYIVGYSGVQTSDYYGNAWMSYCYDIEPFWVPSTNTNTMPGNDETFSQLPASLVYYYDSNNKKHFCDEGLFLQTLERDGKVKLTLKFSADTGAQVKINFSKKPFDSAWTNSDKLTFKIDNTEYTDYIFRPSENPSVSVEIENLIKNDNLYMFWNAQVASNYCQLDEITSFTFIEDN